MPQPAKIDTLPADVRQELQVRVIHGGFSGYEAHSDWLKSQGYEIGPTAISRYFKPIKEESRRQLAAVAATSHVASLGAALAREGGEDVSLATEHAIEVATHERLRDALMRGELELEDLERFQEMTRWQRLTRLRAATERKRAVETERVAPGNDATIADRVAEAGVEATRRAGLSAEGEAEIRAKYEGSP